MKLSSSIKKHAQALGRLGGSAKSDAKTRAVRENGRKGGRPKAPPALETQKKIENRAI
jgi:hypothetical protein